MTTRTPHTRRLNQEKSVLGYSDAISVRPGDALSVMVSCRRHFFRADLVHIVCGDTNPSGPGFKEEVVRAPINRRHPGRVQRINAGSYILVPMSAGTDSLSLSAWIWPTTPGRGEQTLLARWNPRTRRGFRLFLDDAGALALTVGDGKRVATVSTGEPMLVRHWYFVTASFDAGSKSVAVRQRRARAYARGRAEASATRRVLVASATPGTHEPLLMAAHRVGRSGGRLRTAAHYNGKLEAPRYLDRVLREGEPETGVVAAWDFSRDITSERIGDISGNGFHGTTVNLPTRAVTGQNWSGEEVRWTAAPEQYGAIHFHDDDLSDAAWEPSFRFTVPLGLQSGAYAVRLRTDDDEDYVPFFVRRAAKKSPARILYLAQTATYVAYANVCRDLTSQRAELLANRLIVIQPWQQHLNLHPELAGSTYDVHSDGSGVCYASRLRPILNMRPKIVSPVSGGHGSGLWGYNADTWILDWLTAEGHRFDVVTDEDLHRDGVEALAPYRVVMTGTHPEYHSGAMLSGLDRYLDGGGRLMYMGGNGFYWRIAYHPTEPGIIEVRRREDGTRAWQTEPGEGDHSFSGEVGGIWRRFGRAPQRLAGTGFVAQGFDYSSHFVRTPASRNPRIAWAFAGIGPDEPIGNFGLSGGGAAGLEIDAADTALGTPPHALVVATSAPLPDTYMLVSEEVPVTLPDVVGSANPRVRADIVFFETPKGGGVFSFSSIAWAGALSHNNYRNNVARLTGNVLKRFASSKPL